MWLQVGLHRVSSHGRHVQGRVQNPIHRVDLRAVQQQELDERRLVLKTNV